MSGPSTIPGIVASLRCDADAGNVVAWTPLGLRQLADSIEAAAKRELEAEAHRALVECARCAPPKPANAAAMRAALIKIDEAVWHAGRTSAGEKEAHRIASTALSAPARNCDVRDANAAWKDFLERGNNAEISASYQAGANAAIRWLYAAAEGAVP